MAAKLLKNNNLSIQQARADLQIVDQIVNAIENNSGNSKFLRGQASYHLQQASEKLIKIQIYSNSSSIDYHKMYEHDIKKLLNYGSSLGITLDIPNDIEKNAMTITAWEASGRYDLHVVTKITTIKKYSRIIWDWYDDLFSKGYR